MHCRLTFLLFISWIQVSIAQDTLVYYKDITFSSPYEKSVFDSHFLNKKTDLFQLFMANGNLLKEDKITQQETNFYQHISTIKNDAKFTTRKNDKNLKYFYDDLHQTFLQKYELKNKFEEIFYNGYYNCVSASALYALAFTDAKLPFSIKEKPTHVYLIAYPASEKIIVETTSPLSGYRAIDPSMKQAFVKMLKDQKLISNQEYLSYDVNILFDKFYFKDEQEITVLNLVGIQYCNDGLYKFDDKKYDEALIQFEKAYLFYPTEKVAYLMLLTNWKALEERKEKDTKHAQFLSNLSRFKKYGITEEMIVGEFSHVVRKLLETDEKEKLTSYYHLLDSTIKDKSLKKEISFLYQYESGRALYTYAYFNEAIPYFERAVEIKPGHKDASAALISSVTQFMDGSRDPEEGIKTLEDYSIKYPSLKNHKGFNRIMAHSYLQQFGMNYDFEKAAAGEKYRISFENFASKYPDLSIDTNLIGKSYSLAAVYYFKKGQVNKAKSLLATGLKYAPQNYELLSRQRMIK